jgi:hypothetical protein
MSEDFGFLKEALGLSFCFPFFVGLAGCITAVANRSKFSSAFGPSVHSGFTLIYV